MHIEIKCVLELRNRVFNGPRVIKSIVTGLFVFRLKITFQVQRFENVNLDRSSKSKISKDTNLKVIHLNIKLRLNIIYNKFSPGNF